MEDVSEAEATWSREVRGGVRKLGNEGPPLGCTSESPGSFLDSAAQVHPTSIESKSFQGGSHEPKFWKCSLWDSDAQKG